MTTEPPVPPTTAISWASSAPPYPLPDTGPNVDLIGSAALILTVLGFGLWRLFGR